MIQGLSMQMVDTGRATVGDLLAVAVQLEDAARHLYEGLDRMFSHFPDVAAFWRRFAVDEVFHAKRLIELRASTSLKRLSQAVDASMLEAGRKLLGVAVEDRLRNVHHLDDAYEMAHELENSETNAIFRFLITQFSQDKHVVASLMRDLDDHVERLMTGLPVPYATRAARRDVTAQHA